MKYFFCALALIASLISLWGCNEDTFVDPVVLTQVRGQVLYSINRTPARNASVKLTPSGRITATDSAGNFRFDSVLAGKYTIQASKTGYGTEVATLETTADVSPAVTILLTDDKTQNRPPTAPTLVLPAINSTMQSTTLTLKWKATDPNRDSLTYDVLLYRTGSSTPTASYTGLTADTLVVQNLDYNITYLWQVIVKDGVNTVNGPVWSFRTVTYPDYSYLFARRVNNQLQIFAANATGSAAQLTRDGSNWRPTASPNRQQIAFISNQGTDLQLYVMNTDGSNSRQVTTIPISGLSPTDLSFSWSPDGLQLLYPSNDRLYSIRIDGTGLRTVAQAPPGRIFSGCDWTAQGNRIVARTTSTSIYDNELTIIPAGGGTPTAVYARRTMRVGNPVFSVSGRLITFSADSSGFQNESGRQLDSRIYLLDLTTNQLTDLSLVQLNNNNQTQNKPGGTNDLDPRFSPTGAQIIFTNTDNTGNGIRSVYTYDIDGRNRKLAFSQAEMPYWR